jgi:hypothetical protein
LVFINTTTKCDAPTSGKAAGYPEVMVTTYFTTQLVLIFLHYYGIHRETIFPVH